MSNQENEQELTMEERLKAIAYQFIKLYERWSEDRQVLMKQAADTAALMQQFEGQLNKFKEIDPVFRKRLGEFIRQEAENVSKEVGETVGQAASEAATAQVESVAESLQNTVDSAQRAIQAQTAMINRLTWIFWAVVFAVSLFAGLCAGAVVYQFMIKPPALTQEQQVNLSAGEFLRNNLWPKLSKKEQARLLAIGGIKDKSATASTDNAVQDADAASGANNADNMNATQ